MNGLLEIVLVACVLCVFWGLINFFEKKKQEGRQAREDEIFVLRMQEEDLEIASNKIPESYLKRPHDAVTRWGGGIADVWLEFTEPVFRNWGGYPPDWEWRKYVVKLRDNGACKKCGRIATRSRMMHVHHIVPISKGGLHGLGNLTLLCENCHHSEHPNNTSFKKFSRPIQKSSRHRQQKTIN